MRDEQVSELTRVRDEMDREIEELTANLFEVSELLCNGGGGGETKHTTKKEQNVQYASPC